MRRPQAIATEAAVSADLVDRLTRYRARLVAQGRAASLRRLDAAIAEARAALAEAQARCPLCGERRSECKKER